MSSMNTTTNLSKYSINTLFIMVMKYVGAFVSTKDITVYSYKPYLVVKAVFWYVLLPDLQLEVARSQINLAKHLCSFQLIKQIIYVRQGVFVLDGYFIQRAIVHH